MKKRFAKWMIGVNRIIVLLLLLLAVINLISPLFLTFPYGRDPDLNDYFAIHHTIKRLLCFTLLIIAWRLYKRVSAAWMIAMLVLSLGIFQYLFLHHSNVFHPLFILEVICYFVLMGSKNYYCRRMDRYSFKRGISVYLLYGLFIFFNAGVAVFQDKGAVSFFGCIKQTVEVIFDLDHLNVMAFSQHAVYHSFIFWFSWICIITGLILALTPYIGSRIRDQEEMKSACELVKKYGQNCNSYLALEKDKSLLFGKTVKGVIAYGIVRDTMVVLGDPICAREDFLEFLAEIKNYCEKNAYSLLFLNTTEMYLPEYKQLGMGSVKCGVEPRFYLPAYSIAGGQAAKVRLNINHATKAGLSVREYDPRTERDAALEREMTGVSQEWFAMKKSGELVFTMGGIEFENPMDRRYFYAVDAENRVEGFIVFVPFGGMNGYMADVTRHRRNVTRGVMEKIFYEAMMTFREEGVQWGSLAVAPLARLEEEPEVTARLLNTIYEKMNRIYGFKTLYQTKQKYNPTCWEQSYFVYYPPVFSPAMAYAIIKIQNPLGLKDYIKAFVRGGREGKQQDPLCNGMASVGK